MWSKLFLEAWRFLPNFTTMHRFGIETIIGDEIILNVIAVEEVRDYHRETLVRIENNLWKNWNTVPF